MNRGFLGGASCAAAVSLAALLWTAPAGADDFLVRIGDEDGFGYGTAPAFKAANGGPANLDGLGLLGNRDFLPDINEAGLLRDEGQDEFDFRSAGELANTAIEFADSVKNALGTTGSKFTDISLNRKYDARSSTGQILVGGNPISGLTRGPGGPFPSPPSNNLPNQPGFVFDFDVENSELDPSSSIFFNLVFGDYDVVPASIQITRTDDSVLTIALKRQPNNGTQDGLIQTATATLAFADVFTLQGSLYEGFLRVDFVAPNEPYTAFDFVELSTIPLYVPEPAGIAMLAISLAFIGMHHRRH